MTEEVKELFDKLPDTVEDLQELADNHRSKLSELVLNNPQALDEYKALCKDIETINRDLRYTSISISISISISFLCSNSLREIAPSLVISQRKRRESCELQQKNSIAQRKMAAKIEGAYSAYKHLI